MCQGRTASWKWKRSAEFWTPSFQWVTLLPDSRGAHLKQTIHLLKFTLLSLTHLCFLLHRPTVQPLILLLILKTHRCEENKHWLWLTAVSGYLIGILSQGMSWHPFTVFVREELLGNQFITCDCLLLSSVSGVATAKSLFMANLGKVNIRARCFSWDLFQPST